MTSPYPSSNAPSLELGGSAQRSRTTAGGSSTSSLRPRNRRLISTELTSPRPGANGGSENRAVSPIPSRHPSRIVGSQRGSAGVVRPVGGLVRSGQDAASDTLSPTAGFGKSLWEGGWSGSWTALQGLASSVLGTDVANGSSDGEGVGVGRKGGDAARKRARGHSVAKGAPATWGPSGASRGRGDITGAGTLEERDLAVKAMKTASVLETHEGVNGGLDVNGNYKRRTSMERWTPSVQEVGDQDTSVYVHHVQPSDTLAGVVLKYNCQPAIFRKANGLYPNDMIQAREVVFLPVDACGIKGRPCDPPSDNKPIDLLTSTPETEDSPSSTRAQTNGGAWGQESQDTGSAASLLFDTHDMDQTKTEGGGKPWIHVRWVLLDSSPSTKPIEIVRLPRKTLGYFPPRRRKSHANSSSVSTPRVSFDLYNMPQLSEENGENPINPPPPPRLRSDVGSPSGERGYFPAPTSNPYSRTASSSNSSAPSTWLRGPGGVGTFDVRNPGPAQDSLNIWAAKHVPILGIGHLSSSSATSGEVASYGFTDELASIVEMPRYYPTSAGSGAVTPSGGGQSIGMGLEHAAAAIEGWVRRLAIKAAPGTPKLGLGNKAVPELGEGEGEGDLIELLDGPGSDDGRGFEPGGMDNSRSTLGGVSGRADHAATTLRGRAQGSASAKGKSD